jgi:class 3 adenylate cyclase
VSVSEPRECTALVVDIRDFTSAYRSSGSGDDGGFFEFVQAFYSEVLVCLELVDDGASLYVNPTGDGAVAVFFDRDHAAIAFGAGLLMCSRLPAFFTRRGHLPRSSPLDSFGVGVETGTVRVVDSAGERAGISTCIGDAINVAARLEVQTKFYARTPMFVGERLYERLSSAIEPGFCYPEVKERALGLSPGAELSAAVDQLEHMNRRLRLRYVNELYLGGVGGPLATFRYSPSLAGGDDDIAETMAALLGDRHGVIARFRQRMH